MHAQDYHLTSSEGVVPTITTPRCMSLSEDGSKQQPGGGVVIVGASMVGAAT